MIPYVLGLIYGIMMYDDGRPLKWAQSNYEHEREQYTKSFFFGVVLVTVVSTYPVFLNV